MHFAISGLKLTKYALTLLQENPARILIFGHSHIPFIGAQGKAEGKTYLFNPGSAGPPRFRLPTTMGFIRISSGELKFNQVDLSTREAWRPR